MVTLLEQKGALLARRTRGSTRSCGGTPRGEDADSIARNNRVFWAHAGMVRQRLGRYKEAAEAFGEAANSGKEKDASLVTYRIDALISAKDFDKALKEARAAATGTRTRVQEDESRSQVPRGLRASRDR